MVNLVSIRSMTAEDLRMVLIWRNHPSVRRVMFTAQEISFEEHSAWFDSIKSQSDRQLYILEDGLLKPFGFVQFDNVGTTGPSNWGFYVRPDAEKGMGRQLGIAALDHAFDKLVISEVHGQTIPENEASIRLHRKLGFKVFAPFETDSAVDHNERRSLAFCLTRDSWRLARQNLLKSVSSIG